PPLATTANKRRHWRIAARAFGAGRGALLAAALLGAASFDARAQSGTLASYTVTDPHGNAVTFGDLFGIQTLETTLPYLILTATPAVAGESLVLTNIRGSGDRRYTLILQPGAPQKIHLYTSTTGTLRERINTFELSVGGAVDLGLIITRTLGGIPDDPVMAVPVIGANSLAISWSAPTDTGGADITGYKIRWTTAAAPGTYLNTNAALGADVSGGASATTHAITGLTNDLAYGVEVAAVNSHGAGGWADVQLGTPGTPGTPSAPRNLTATGDNTQLNLTWRVPQNTGGADLENYRVRWAEGADSTNWIDPTGADGREIPGGASTLLYAVPGLTNGTTYSVQVAAENSNGIGEWASQNGAPMPVPPGMPQSVTSAISSQTLTLSWAAPASDGGAAISDYIVRWKDTNLLIWTNPPGSTGESAGADLSHTLSGLSNGTRYLVQVAAVNSAGTGAWSASHQNTPKAVPSMPRNLAVTGGGGRLNLRWTAPAGDGGSAITGYAVRWAEGAGSSAWVIPPGASGDATGSTATNYALDGLKSATTYEVQIAARNRAGISAWTASAQGATDSFDIDVDANGMVEWKDGVMIARHLAGLRGAALVTGMGGSLDAATVAAKINSGALAGMLDVDDSNTTTAADGIMIARYLLGVTSGNALTEGMTATDSAAVAGNIAGLPRPSQ
ncbi:MAG: fibronectin type III domain-containing protein, partial [Gammaproteobacteria bacterium]